MLSFQKKTTTPQPVPPAVPEVSDQFIKQILLAENYVSKEDMAKAENYAKEQNAPLTDYLFKQEIITQSLLGQAIAESFTVPFSDLLHTPPNSSDVVKLPEEIARTHHVVITRIEDKVVTVATDNPKSEQMRLQVASVFPGKKIDITYAFAKEIDEVLQNYKKPLSARFDAIVTNGEKIAPEIITEIFKDALSSRASDIHLEPEENRVVIRFRIDGVLQKKAEVTKEVYENLLNRIKILAHLRIDEHFSSQDGAIRLTIDTQAVDMRVSLIPTLNGEKVVIRILSSYIRDFSLDEMGLSQAHQELLLNASQKPFGMILVTGPTGSGKSSTLYALLKLLNTPTVNITTIEDPVEYKIAGINQIQVNTATNLTFAKGLRSIVRQDPNIILVGEIRDGETAEIAVNAALTGHLLLSTFHANDAATAIPRLLEIGIEPFLLASTLELIIAQRLVRRICGNCRISEAIKKDEIKKRYPLCSELLIKNNITTFYKGKGCGVCGNTGYKGRIAIFEFIEVTPELEELLLKNPSALQIQAFAQKQGATSMFIDGLEKIKNGLTTVEELLRVASPPKGVNVVRGKGKS